MARAILTVLRDVKPHDAIPRAWLRVLISPDRDKAAVEKFLVEHEHIMPCKVDFDNLWIQFNVTAGQPSPTEEVWWFESSGKSHCGLALVRGTHAVCYQLVRRPL